MKTSKLMLLPKEDSGLHQLIARVHGSHINSAFKRRDAVIIENPQTGAKIIRYVLGHGGLPGVTKQAIAVDYDGLETLGYRMKPEQCANLIVRKAKPYESIYYLTKHPDLVVQLSIKLALLSTALGLIGLVGVIVSLMSLF
jgi:hypothetical protein